jgi:hypothetical protein
MKKKRTAPPASIVGLTPMELNRKIPLAEAARLNSIHIQTFRKRYPHLLRRIGERRWFISLHDAITLPPPPDTS